MSTSKKYIQVGLKLWCAITFDSYMNRLCNKSLERRIAANVVVVNSEQGICELYFFSFSSVYWSHFEGKCVSGINTTTVKYSKVHIYLGCNRIIYTNVILYTLYHSSQYIYVYIFQESIGGVARQYKGNKKASVREKYKMAQALSDRLKRIMEDVS